jgi:hypothetical protein
VGLIGCALEIRIAYEEMVVYLGGSLLVMHHDAEGRIISADL